MGNEQPGDTCQGNEQHRSPDPGLTARHQVETSPDDRDDDQETKAQPQDFESGARGQRAGLKASAVLRLFLHLLQETLRNVSLNRLIGRQVFRRRYRTDDDRLVNPELLPMGHLSFWLIR